MKKLTFLTSVILLVVSCSTGQKQDNGNIKKEKTGWVKDNLKDKVKSITAVDYEAVVANGQVHVERKFDSSIWNYDNQGHQLETFRYNWAGKLETTWTFKFDKNDNPVEDLGVMANGDIVTRDTYKYDESGNRLEELHAPNGVPGSKYTFEYDENGHQIAKIQYDAKGTVEYKWTAVWNNKGELQEESAYEGGKDLSFKVAYKYRADGKKIQENYFKPDGSPDEYITFTYDGKGRQVEVNFFNASGSLARKETTKFDDQENETEKIKYRGASMYRKTVCEYQYDNKLNWTKQTCTYEDGTATIQERKLTYY